MFTIEIKKRGKDEEFAFEDLELFHRECFGGRIKINLAEGYHSDSGFKHLVCKRCYAMTKTIGPDIIVEIIKTAIDGQERKISEDITVI